MRGFVDEIKELKTKKEGRPFQVYRIEGAEIYQWDSAYFGRVKEGDLLDFEVKESGEFKNIDVKRIFKVVSEEYYNKLQERVREKEQVIRMSSLKTSANLLFDLKASPYERGSLTIDLADQFGKYIRGEEIDEDFLRPREITPEPDEGKKAWPCKS